MAKEKKVKKSQSKAQKKSGKKKKEEVEKEELTEVDREIYTLQIADLTRKYERLKARVLELETEKEELQKSFEQLDEDRADIIAYVKRELQKKIDEIAELNERLEGLQKSKDEENANYREKILQLEHDYKVMHEQLTSEIKLLSGKLNSLEEFRTQRDELMKKFKDQENRMQDQEANYKNAMYELERKFIIGKDKLKKEMEYRLLQLSQDFQDTTQLRVAATTNRTVRENIALNNELNLMLASTNQLRQENEAVKESDTKLRLGLELHVEEKKMVLAKNRVQKKIIDTLTTRHEQMQELMAELKHKVNTGKTMENKLTATQEELIKVQMQIAELEQKLDASNYEQAMLRLGTVEAEKETKKLQGILRHTIKAVKSVLEVQTTPSEDEAYNTSLRESLLSNLLALLNMADLSPEEPEPVQPEPEIYETGDLGLITKVTSIETVGSGNYSRVSFKKSAVSIQSALSETSGSKSTLTTSSKSTTSTKSKEEEQSEAQAAQGQSSTSVKARGSKTGSLASIKESSQLQQQPDIIEESKETEEGAQDIEHQTETKETEEGAQDTEHQTETKKTEEGAQDTEHQTETKETEEGAQDTEHQTETKETEEGAQDTEHQTETKETEEGAQDTEHQTETKETEAEIETKETEAEIETKEEDNV